MPSPLADEIGTIGKPSRDYLALLSTKTPKPLSKSIMFLQDLLMFEDPGLMYWA